MSQSIESLSQRAAADALGVSDRHLRRLLATGALDRVQAGRQARVTSSSVEKYHSERKKADISPDMSYQCPIEDVYVQAVRQAINQLPPLSEPSKAARRLGIPQGKFAKLIQSGDIPVLEIGGMAFVPSYWLASQLAQALGVPVGDIPRPVARR